MADVNISKYRASVVRDGSKPASPGFVVSEGQDPVNPPGTNNFVPYTGATANVELGEFGVEAGFVTLDTTPTNIPTDQGAIYWDDTRSTAALIMNGTLQHIGQDSFFYVKNSSGSTIPKGTCVGFAGTDGGSGHLLVTPFLANGSVPSTYFMGVTSEEIANGSFGQVMHFGELTGINTSGFTAGALLYASSTVAGGFQTTAPVAPNNIILVAAAVNSKNNGAIVVRPTLGSNINTDEGIKITSPTTGDLLQLQAGGLWENKTIDGAGIVTKATSQVISGLKTFNVNTLMMQSSGNANAVYLSNSSGSSTYQSGFNFFGFNTDNHIYFAKSSITGGNTGILAWTNTATRTYTLKDASGTLAFVSDIPSLSGYVQGSGTTNYISKFTGSGTIGNSQIFDNGTNVGINQASPTRTVDILGASGIGTVLKLQGASGTTTYLQLAYNGATNAQSGYIGYNSSSQMQFFTNDTLAMTIDSNRNLGLGVTPSAWTAGGRNIEVGSAGNIIQAQLGQIAVIQNATFNAGWKYSNNGFASFNLQTSGQHQWFNAPSGTAGNAISFTQAMTLNASGNLLVGTTSDNGERLQVNGEITAVTRIRINKTTQTNQLFGDGNAFTGGTSGDLGIRNDSGRILFASGGGTIQMLLNSSGNLLVGTTTDIGQRLQVSGGYIAQVDGGVRTFLGYDGSGSLIGTTTNHYFRFITNDTERMRITSSGNVGIGTSSPNRLLTVSGTTSGLIALNASSFRNTTIGSDSVGNFIVYDDTAGVYRMAINSSGNVLIGTTTDNGARLQVSGAVNITGEGTHIGIDASGGIGRIGFVKQSGAQPFMAFAADPLLIRVSNGSTIAATNTFSTVLSIASTGAATFSSLGTGTVYSNGGTLTNTNPSDFNLKKNIAPINYGLGEILQLNPVTFNWKNDTINQGKQYGFIAQEVQKIMPDLVKKGEYLGLDKDAIFTTLVKAIQEQQEIINDLKQRIQ